MFILHVNNLCQLQITSHPLPNTKADLEKPLYGIPTIKPRLYKCFISHAPEPKTCNIIILS